MASRCTAGKSWLPVPGGWCAALQWVQWAQGLRAADTCAVDDGARAVGWPRARQSTSSAPVSGVDSMPSVLA